MRRDVNEPLEELVADLEDQIHQDCCVQELGEFLPDYVMNAPCTDQDIDRFEFSSECSPFSFQLIGKRLTGAGVVCLSMYNEHQHCPLILQLLIVFLRAMQPFASNFLSSLSLLLSFSREILSSLWKKQLCA